MDDVNMVVLSGRLASPPEVRRFDSGTELVRLLITVRSEAPDTGINRVDVIPVTIWGNPDVGSVLDEIGDDPVGARFWIAGSAQRRFWDGTDGRRSRIEVVAPAVGGVTRTTHTATVG